EGHSAFSSSGCFVSDHARGGEEAVRQARHAVWAARRRLHASGSARAPEGRRRRDGHAGAGRVRTGEARRGARQAPRRTHEGDTAGQGRRRRRRKHREMTLRPAGNSRGGLLLFLALYAAALLLLLPRLTLWLDEILTLIGAMQPDLRSLF